jgi:hypothetical protein
MNIDEEKAALSGGKRRVHHSDVLHEEEAPIAQKNKD